MAGPFDDDEEDEFDIPLETQLRRRAGADIELGIGDDFEDEFSQDDEEFLSPTPSIAADRYARRAMAEDAFIGGSGVDRVQSSTGLDNEGFTLDYSKFKKAEPKTYDTLDVSTAKSVPVEFSDDEDDNYNKLGAANPDLFGAIKDGVDINEPTQRAQDRQLRFFAKIAATEGGADRWYSSKAQVRRSMIEQYATAEMEQLFPGYGRGRKITPEMRAYRKTIVDDLAAARDLKLNGLAPKEEERLSLVGDTPDDTISNVLNDKTLDAFSANSIYQDLDDDSRRRVINNIIDTYYPKRSKDPAIQAERERVEAELAPVFENADLFSEHFAKRGNKDAPTPAQEAVKDTVEAVKESHSTAVYDVASGVAASTATSAKDIGLGFAGGVAKGVPSLLAAAAGLVKTADSYITDATGAEPTPSPVTNFIQDKSRQWSEYVDSWVSAGQSDEFKAEKVQLQTNIAEGDATDKKVKIGEGEFKFADNVVGRTLKSVDSFVNAAFSNPEAAADMVFSSLGEVVGSAGAAKVGVKAVEKLTAKELGDASKHAAVALASAATASSSTQTSMLQAALPADKTARDQLVAKYAQSELSKFRAKQAKDEGWTYDVAQDYETVARENAAKSGTLAGFLTIVTAYAPGSVERVIAKADKKSIVTALAEEAASSGGKVSRRVIANKIVEGVIKSGLSEAAQEAFEEYATAVHQSYMSKVVAEYKTTGNLDKLTRSLGEQQNITQAVVGAALGLFGGSAVAATIGAKNTVQAARTAEEGIRTANTNARAATRQRLAERGAQQEEVNRAREARVSAEEALAAKQRTNLDPIAAQALASQRGQAAVADDGTIYAPAPVQPAPTADSNDNQPPPPSTGNDNTPLDTAQRDTLEAQLRTRQRLAERAGSEPLTPAERAANDAFEVSNPTIPKPDRAAEELLRKQASERAFEIANPVIPGNDIAPANDVPVDRFSNPGRRVANDQAARQARFEQQDVVKGLEKAYRTAKGRVTKLYKSKVRDDAAIAAAQQDVDRIGRELDEAAKVQADLEATAIARNDTIPVYGSDGKFFARMRPDDYAESQRARADLSADIANKQAIVDTLDIQIAEASEQISAAQLSQAERTAIVEAMTIARPSTLVAGITMSAVPYRIGQGDGVRVNFMAGDRNVGGANITVNPGGSLAVTDLVFDNTDPVFKNKKKGSPTVTSATAAFNRWVKNKRDKARRTNGNALAAAKLKSELTDQKKDVLHEIEQARDEFKKSWPGMDPDTPYLNRQAGIAQNPMPVSELSTVKAQLDREIMAVTVEAGVAVPVTIIPLENETQVKQAVEQFKLGNSSFATYAPPMMKIGGNPTPIIFVNLTRIESGDTATLVRDLRAKIFGQFVLPKLTRDNTQFRVALDNIVASVSKTRQGREIVRRVQAAYANNNLNVKPHTFNLAVIGAVIEDAPYTVGADGKRKYTFTKGLAQRVVEAVGRTLNRLGFNRLASAIGYEPGVDINKVVEFLSELTHIDGNAHTAASLEGDWSQFFVEPLNKQRREYLNINRYNGRFANTIRNWSDKALLSMTLDSAARAVARGNYDGSLGDKDVVARKIMDVRNLVHSRVIRVDTMLHNEIMPLADTFRDALRNGAKAANVSVEQFTSTFDRYVQLLSTLEMVSPGGDMYKNLVSLSKDGEAQIETRLRQLKLDLESEHSTDGRTSLGQKASRDVDKIIADDLSLNPDLAAKAAKIAYAGYTAARAKAEIDAMRRNNPAVAAAMDQAMPGFRAIIDKATSLRIQSGKYDPADIAFRNRAFFVYRGGTVIDAEKVDYIIDDGLSHVLDGRKSLATPFETVAAEGRADLPRNSSIEAMTQLIDAAQELDLAQIGKGIAYVTQVDNRLGKMVGDKRNGGTQEWDRSELELEGKYRFDFKYLGHAKKGSTKSITFTNDSGKIETVTFTHDDMANGVRDHSIEGKWAKVAASLHGWRGALFTSRNPAFVATRQLPRDVAHTTFAIVRNRHGWKAAGEFAAALVTNAPSVWRYAYRHGADRATFARGLGANSPTRRAVERGVWFGAHTQFSTSDIITNTSRNRFRDQVQDIQAVRAIGNTLAPAGHALRFAFGGFSEFADNLVRVAYFDVATRPDTHNRVNDDGDALVNAMNLMDFTNGSPVQRLFSPWFSYARANANGQLNLMLRDLTESGQAELQAFSSAEGDKLRVVSPRAAATMVFKAAYPLAMLGGAGYIMAAMSRGDDEEPPTAAQAMEGIGLPFGYQIPSQYGVLRLISGFGALVAGTARGDYTVSEAARAYVNAVTKELPPGMANMQFVPSTDHASWFKTLVAQVLGSNVFTTMTGVHYNLNTTNFGRSITNPNDPDAGRLTTPQVYKDMVPEGVAPELAPYVLDQIGFAGDILDMAARLNSGNQTNEDTDRAVQRTTGLNAFVVGGGPASRIQRIQNAESELMDGFGAAKRRAQRDGGDKAVRELVRATEGGRQKDAYLTLDRSLRREYSEKRREWAGRPDFSERMMLLEAKHREKRQRALDRIKAKTGKDVDTRLYGGGKLLFPGAWADSLVGVGTGVNSLMPEGYDQTGVRESTNVEDRRVDPNAGTFVSRPKPKGGVPGAPLQPPADNYQFQPGSVSMINELQSILDAGRAARERKRAQFEAEYKRLMDSRYRAKQ